MITYLFGGRLGDFIHGLIIPAYIYDQTGEKARILLSNNGDPFTAGIEQTFSELRPVMGCQRYVHSFEMYDGEDADIDITRFRQCPDLERQCWTDTYFSTFIPGGRRPPFNYTWLSWYSYSTRFRAIYNRGYMHDRSNEYWADLIRRHVAAKLVNNSISGMMDQINNSDLYIGDQSAPTAIACALGIKRMVELNRCKAMYQGEHQYTDKMSTFSCGYVPYERTR
jgi:hypothetical protein